MTGLGPLGHLDTEIITLTLEISEVGLPGPLGLAACRAVPTAVGTPTTVGTTRPPVSSAQLGFQVIELLF